MRIAELVNAINGKVVCGEEMLQGEVEFAFASDLMSDVLTIQSDGMMLLTGLANVQAVRTAEMSDISCVVFVRNKKATPEMIELALENNTILIECPYSMFKASGILFQSGLKPVF